uniref:Uncharacterized protein n=2 Tax=Fiersviridae TaxID=2842319 RepID=A0A514D222_9VIRU|nr:MAG: hypothetical protein H3Bulk41463_000004 [Leviviridae sp.]
MPNKTPTTGVSVQRTLLKLEFEGYARIVNQKHGFTVLQDLTDSNFDVESLSDDELQRVVSVLKDMAHLPPA